MKKFIFAGILSILFVSVTFAQTRFGVTAGLNASKVSVKDINPKPDFRAGF